MAESIDTFQQAAAPSHYHQGSIDPLDLMCATGDDRSFAKGSVIKYVHRHEYKQTPLEDLLKALFYLGWLIGTASGRDWAGRRKMAVGLVNAAQTLLAEGKP